MDSESLLELVTLALKNKKDQESNSNPSFIQGEWRIVILQRGWVYVGKYFRYGYECHLENASCIRKWGTNNGLSQLANEGPLSETKLEPCETRIEFHRLTETHSILCNPLKWNN